MERSSFKGRGNITSSTRMTVNDGPKSEAFVADTISMFLKEQGGTTLEMLFKKEISVLLCVFLRLLATSWHVNS